MLVDNAIFAAGVPQRSDGLASNRGSGQLFNDVLLIIGTALALGLVLALIIKIAYRSRGSGKSPATESSGGFFSSGRRKRREHRPRNPTLAETGGLPPPRTGPPEPPRP